MANNLDVSTLISGKPPLPDGGTISPNNGNTAATDQIQAFSQLLNQQFKGSAEQPVASQQWLKGLLVDQDSAAAKQNGGNDLPIDDENNGNSQLAAMLLSAQTEPVVPVNVLTGTESIQQDAPMDFVASEPSESEAASMDSPATNIEVVLGLSEPKTSAGPTATPSPEKEPAAQKSIIGGPTQIQPNLVNNLAGVAENVAEPPANPPATADQNKPASSPQEAALLLNRIAGGAEGVMYSAAKLNAGNTSTATNNDQSNTEGESSLSADNPHADEPAFDLEQLLGSESTTKVNHKTFFQNLENRMMQSSASHITPNSTQDAANISLTGQSNDTIDTHLHHQDSVLGHSDSTQGTTSKTDATFISTPMAKNPAWQQAFGDKVLWLVNRQVQEAELKLNPAHLGSIDVKVSVQHDQASVVFSSQNGMVRDMVEAAIPRLRDMLNEAGLTLVNVDVSDKSFNGQRNGERLASTRPRGQSSDKSVESLQLSGRRIMQDLSPNLVDYYA